MPSTNNYNMPSTNNYNKYLIRKANDVRAVDLPHFGERTISFSDTRRHTVGVLSGMEGDYPTREELIKRIDAPVNGQVVRVLHPSPYMLGTEEKVL